MFCVCQYAAEVVENERKPRLVVETEAQLEPFHWMRPPFESDEPRPAGAAIVDDELTK